MRLNSISHEFAQVVFVLCFVNNCSRTAHDRWKLSRNVHTIRVECYRWSSKINFNLFNYNQPRLFCSSQLTGIWFLQLSIPYFYEDTATCSYSYTYTVDDGKYLHFQKFMQFPGWGLMNLIQQQLILKQFYFKEYLV